MISFPHRSEYNVANSPPWDRLTTVEDHRAEAMANWTDGAYPDGWLVSPGSGMSVEVSAGMGRIQGVFCYDEPTDGEYVPRTLALQPAHATYDRIDRVVVRLNDGQDYRSCDWYILQGSPATSPSPPELTRTDEVYELCVAQIYVTKGSTGVSEARISDTRLNYALCGLTNTRVWDLAIEEIKGLLEAAIDETAAGELQNTITALAERPTRITSSIDATQATKGLLAFDLPLYQELTLVLTKGNKAANPVLTFNDTVHSLVGLPTVGLLDSTAQQVFRFQKTGENQLTLITTPDYEVERGTVGIFNYSRYVSGKVEVYTPAVQVATPTTMISVESNDDNYKSNDINLALPAGMFNSADYLADFTPATKSYTLGINPIFSSCTTRKLVFVIVKGGASAAGVSYKLKLEGTWYTSSGWYL